jgi:hypothetical protein
VFVLIAIGKITLSLIGTKKKPKTSESMSHMNTAHPHPWRCSSGYVILLGPMVLFTHSSQAARVLWAQHCHNREVPDDNDTIVEGEIVSVDETEKLSPEEIDAVIRERDLSFWAQPWPLKTTYLMLFLAATVQGWTQTATNGANLSWPTALKLDDGASGSSSNTPYGITTCAATPNSIWAFAAVNAAPYLAAGV